MKLEFHPDAEQEFLEAVLRYEAEVPSLGERFDAEIREATIVLLEYPEIGAPIDIELRKLVLDRFPYSLIYSLTSETVYVLAVAHEASRTGGWRQLPISHQRRFTSAHTAQESPGVWSIVATHVLG